MPPRRTRCTAHRYLAILLLSLLAGAGAGASVTTLDLGDSNAAFSYREHLQYRRSGTGGAAGVDPYQELRAPDWLRPGAADGLAPTEGIYWFRLDLVNSSDLVQTRVFRFMQYRARRVDTWSFRNESLVEHVVMGSRAEGGGAAHRGSHTITVPAGDSAQVLVRLDTREHLAFSYLSLITPQEQWVSIYERAVQVGRFSGVALITAVLNLVLFLVLREIAPLLLSLWIMTMSQHMLSYYGEGAINWLSRESWLSSLLDHAALTAASVFAMLFSMLFLGTRRHTPHLQEFLWLLLSLQVGVFLVYAWQPGGDGMRVSESINALAWVVLFVAGSIAWWRGRPAVRFFVLGNGLLVCYLLVMGVTARWFPDHLVAVGGQMLTVTTLQVLLMSLAQMDRLSMFKRSKEAAELASRTDPLTEIPNRRAFDLALDQALETMREKHSRVSLLLLDIDYFKYYNDSLGHQQGDECLRQVARVVDSSLSRPQDLAARFGGEEFAVVLPGAGPETARRVANTIRLGLKEAAIPHPGSQISSRLTLSIGIATATADAGPDSATELIAEADQRLYQAKAQGRDRMVEALAA